jgi:hypothetical protein
VLTAGRQPPATDDGDKRRLERRPAETWHESAQNKRQMALFIEYFYWRGVWDEFRNFLLTIA